MAREARRYFYECVATCQMGYMAPSYRREEWGEDGVPPMVLHERTFYPKGLGKKRPDYLCTTEPISRRYTEEQPRKFFKRDLRTNKMREINTPTTVKFVLLDSNDIGDYVRDHARMMTLRECDLASSDDEREKKAADENKILREDVVEAQREIMKEMAKEVANAGT